MPEKMDYKKISKELYLPGRNPEIVNVPRMRFLMVNGQGNPNREDGEFARATTLLYGLSYTISMSGKGKQQPDGYFPYVVPPLEGLWWTPDDTPFDGKDKGELIWTLMIRQPEFVTEEVFRWATGELERKKPGTDVSGVLLRDYTEGWCVQMMHLGSYDTEDATVEVIDTFAQAQGWISAISLESPEGILLRHHEVYLNDPRKTSPEKLKTVLRHPVMRK